MTELDLDEILRLAASKDDGGLLVRDTIPALVEEVRKLRAERSAHKVHLEPGDLLVISVPRETSLAVIHRVREIARAEVSALGFEVPVLVAVSPIEVSKAEVVALRRQIEAVEAERDAARAALSKAELRERLREVERDEARAALSSVPDVPAARDDEIEQRLLVAEAQLEAIRQIINDWASDDGVIALVTLPSRIAAALDPSCPPDVPAARDDQARGFVDAATIYACFDAGHDVGLRHEDGSLYSATCHDCGHRYHRNCPLAPAARDEPEPDEPNPMRALQRSLGLPPRSPGPVQVTTLEDPSRAACAACDGSCGTCPYVAVTTPEDKR